MKKAMIWGMNEKSCLEKEATLLAQAFPFLRYDSLVCIFRFWRFFLRPFTFAATVFYSPCSTVRVLLRQQHTKQSREKKP